MWLLITLLSPLFCSSWVFGEWEVIFLPLRAENRCEQSSWGHSSRRVSPAVCVSKYFFSWGLIFIWVGGKLLETSKLWLNSSALKRTGWSGRGDEWMGELSDKTLIFVNSNNFPSKVRHCTVLSSNCCQLCLHKSSVCHKKLIFLHITTDSSEKKPFKDLSCVLFGKVKVFKPMWS